MTYIANADDCRGKCPLRRDEPAKIAKFSRFFVTITGYNKLLRFSFLNPRII